MTTIVEVQEKKIEHLAEYAEKVLRYGGKLMQCLEEMMTKPEYSERSGYKYIDKYKDERSGHRKAYDEEDEFVRYY